MTKLNQTWKSMTGKDMRQLAVAVFFLFATLGPLTILMEPAIMPASWFRFIVLTIVCGMFSAGIILLIEKPVRLMVLIGAFSAFQLSFDMVERTLFPQAEKQLQMLPDQSVKFTEQNISDIELKRTTFGLTAIGCVALGYALFVRFIGKESKRRAEIESEVKFAEEIHRSLLPKLPVKTDWCEISGMSVPATKVGGDFYDIIPLSDNKILIVVADASGHGTGAGVLAAMTKSCIVQELQHTQSSGDLMSKINTTIYRVTEKNMFVTCALALLNNREKTIEITTAGHPQLFLYRRSTGTIEELRTQNIALGIQQYSEFKSMTVPFQSGDSVFLFSDGIFEAANSQQEQFGMERMKKDILTAERFSAEEVCTALIASVRKHTGNKEFQDDVTVVAARI